MSRGPGDPEQSNIANGHGGKHEEGADTAGSLGVSDPLAEQYDSSSIFDPMRRASQRSSMVPLARMTTTSLHHHLCGHLFTCYYYSFSIPGWQVFGITSHDFLIPGDCWSVATKPLAYGALASLY